MQACEDIRQRYEGVRAHSVSLCAPLAIEDHVPQPVEWVSPPKWHLGHTTWFFEAMVLQPNVRGYRVFDERFAFLFNSYYETLGQRVARAQRGALSRPTVETVHAYRAHVDRAMDAWLAQRCDAERLALVELGLQHEQQHQELLLTDTKFILGSHPMAPPYDPRARGPVALAQEHVPETAPHDAWLHWSGGAGTIGHVAGNGFAFDNEGPRHTEHVAPFDLRRKLVTNAEYLAFMADGGYRRAVFWHADGWDWVHTLLHHAPLYWEPDPDHPGNWQHYTLAGRQPLPLEAPVTHLSYYEAFAFCQWAGWRLPTEAEWELLAPHLDWGRRWEWTASAYQPYPGFRPAAGAVGEYNGKFMVNQQVLRGASFATPPGHARLTYRNFFHPPLRWQYTGLRPARDGRGSDA